MSIQLSDNLNVGQQKPLDDKYFNGRYPYESISQVNSILTTGLRYIGLTVNINGDEYWYKDGIGNENLVLKVNSIDNIIPGIWLETGSYYATTNDLQITGSLKIKGDLIVEGQTTLIQKLDPESESLVVSGAMTIIQNQINDQIVSASLTIQGLGTLSDTNNNTVIDLGGFF